MTLESANCGQTLILHAFDLGLLARVYSPFHREGKAPIGFTGRLISGRPPAKQALSKLMQKCSYIKDRLAAPLLGVIFIWLWHPCRELRHTRRLFTWRSKITCSHENSLFSTFSNLCDTPPSICSFASHDGLADREQQPIFSTHFANSSCSLELR